MKEKRNLTCTWNGRRFTLSYQTKEADSGYKEDPTAWTSRLFGLLLLSGLSYTTINRLMKHLKLQRKIKEKMEDISRSQYGDVDLDLSEPIPGVGEKRAVAWADLTLPEKAIYYLVDLFPSIRPDSLLQSLFFTLPIGAGLLYLGSSVGKAVGDWLGETAGDIKYNRRRQKAEQKWREALQSLPTEEKEAMHEAMTKEAGVGDIITGLSLLAFLAPIPFFYHAFKPSGIDEKLLIESRGLYSQTGSPLPVQVDPDELEELVKKPEKKKKERTIRL